MSSCESINNEFDAAEFAQYAIKQAGEKLADSGDPNPGRWDEIARRLRVDSSRVTRHTSHYDWQDQPGQSWEIFVLVDPSQSPMYPVYELLSMAEEYLADKFDDSFFFVPTVMAGTEL